jgi:hypothetical protein
MQSGRAWVYIERMGKLWIGVLVVGVMGAVLFVASVVENKGCMPWQTAVTTGDSVFSESNRSRTVCR